MKVGFIGLGIMGKPMAYNLMKAGHELFLHNRSKTALEELSTKGAYPCKSPSEVAEHCSLIFLMLPDAPDVKKVLFEEENALMNTLKPQSLVVDLSSIAPMESRWIAEQLQEKDIRMLDAPVSGGEPKAIEGTLTIMVGGKESDFKEAFPLLSSMASAVERVGELGAGNTAKLSNQLIVALNIAAVAEGMMLASKANVDTEAVYKAIRGGLAGSNVLDAKAPMMFSHSFKPGFRLNLHMKDMRNVLHTAAECGCSLPLTNMISHLMQSALDQGYGELDHSALLKVVEDLNKSAQQKTEKVEE